MPSLPESSASGQAALPLSGRMQLSRIARDHIHARSLNWPPCCYHHICMAQMVKCLPAMWGTRVQSLGQEDPLEKEMATHSSILAWRILWTEESGGPQSMGRKELDTTE